MTKLVVLLVSALSLAACSRDTSPPSTSSSSASVLPAGMSRVSDPSQVCMVNDQFMGKPQIPVEVEGRTYFGCCAMCKDKLTKQPESRTAQDPVTGEPVDKAKAIIVQDSDGRVKYFASEDTLRRFRG
jgi:YHS domain-containing protein